MTDPTAFDQETITYIAWVASAYFALTLAPAIWPTVTTHKVRKSFPRRWLFVATVFSLSYGIVAAFLVICTIPITAYSTYIAPQLSVEGFHGTDWLIKANGYVASYWWLALPVVLLLVAWRLVRKLQPSWPSICLAMTANNSFKPKPLRGSA